MPATELTIECRKIAARMAAWPGVSGNVAILAGMDGPDSANIEALRVIVAATVGVPGGMSATLTTAKNRAALALEGSGNVALWPPLMASAVDVVAACDFADAQ